MINNFGSLITAMATPFTDRGEVDYKVAAELAVHLAASGSTGLVVAGTTGESPVLSTAEKLELFRVIAAAVKGRAKVIAGTGSNDTAGTVTLTKQAAETGVDGLMLVTPYYNKPTQEGLYRHFKAAAAAAELPVMLYNVPGRTGVNMTAETTLRLAELPNIVAVKEAGGCLEQAAAICRQSPPGFDLYAGDDAAALPLLSIGGVGVVSVAAHLVGRGIAEMIASFKQGRTGKAARLHRELLPLFKGLFVAANPIPLKAALNMIGIAVGTPRLPLLPLEGEQLRQLESLLRQYRLMK